MATVFEVVDHYFIELTKAAFWSSDSSHGLSVRIVDVAYGVCHDKCLLYTTGYTPRTRTYPGHRVPKLLLVIHYGDSEMKEICGEIMGLTKLNWNTTAFVTYIPITLEFSQKVGRVLSELQEG
jgi:hypothetical protein